MSSPLRLKLNPQTSNDLRYKLPEDRVLIQVPPFSGNGMSPRNSGSPLSLISMFSPMIDSPHFGTNMLSWNVNPNYPFIAPPPPQTHNSSDSPVKNPPGKA